MMKIQTVVKKSIFLTSCKTAQIAIVMLMLVTGCSEHNKHDHHSEYAGQQERSIKSLSESDIEALQGGSGWGLAKAAELNGVPGPKHLLEMKKAIDLSQDQIKSIEALFHEMNSEAKVLGELLIEHETELDSMFKNGPPDATALEKQLQSIGEVRTKLRMVHLSAHLETPSILTNAQLDKYNDLRGYSNSDPCTSVPSGHDPVMWKRHNNCS